ncbi:hypothetical protein [Pseudomonas syringae]|uniref:hypothetical protein n=1 Tax=Pseudomonas syringae TaxID=317 RepID=UPI001F077822|nr:hypothetical protein [Pseudomonas syringae]
MKTDRRIAMKVVSSAPAPNTALFISVVSDDPELLQAATSEGFVIVRDSEDSEAMAAEAIAYGDGVRQPQIPAKTIQPSKNGRDDKRSSRADTRSMTEITRDELSSTLLALEERMDRRIERLGTDGDRRSDDYRKEIALRDDQLRREIDLRNTAAQSEQVLRDRSVDERLKGFLAAQSERDKTLIERDKRYEALADRVTKAAEGAEAAAREAATVKTNYWAAVGVQLLAVAAILVGSYFANQGNTLMVAQTTLAAMAAGKDSVPADSGAHPSPNQTPNR